MRPVTTWRALGLALAFVSLLSPLLWRANTYQLYVLALVGLTAIVGVGLNVLIGLAGQFSLGHVAFYGIGAYAVGLLTTKLDVSFWIALPLAGLAAGVAGGLLAIPALAVRGPYLAMVTIAFGFVFEQAAAEWASLTGGWNGLTGVPGPKLLGHAFSEREMAVFVLALTVTSVWLYARLAESPWGRAMCAVRDGETASLSIGIDPRFVRTVAFVLSAVATGLAGGVFAAMSDFISPESFPFLQSILFVVVIMIGGISRLIGPVLGAAVVVLLPELLSWLAQYRLLFFGTLMLVVMRLAPGGIAGLLGTWGTPAVAGRGSRAAVDVEALLASSRRDGAEGDGAEGLEAQGLSLGFGGVAAVSDVSFTARPGRITSIIGPNGAGKSTLLNIVCGFYPADRGRVRLDGAVIADGAARVRDSRRLSRDAARAGIARTFQTTQLFSRMTVADNVRTALQRGRLPLSSLFSPSRDDDHDAAVAESLLAFVGYAGAIDRPCGELSHVDKRIVEIARALAVRPRVLALDEPAAGLDARDKERLGLLLRRIAACGVSVVLVEHDMPLVMSCSDHVVVLDAGRVIATGAPAAVAGDPCVIAAYLGTTESRQRTRTAPLPGVPPAVLSVADLAAGYGGLHVLRGVGLTVGAGEIVAVLGPNGAGKSTLMRTLSGLIRPSAGRIELAGERIGHLEAQQVARRGLTLVPEGRQVFPELSVADNIRLGAYARPSGELEARLERMLDRFPKLRSLRDRRAGLLSGGEQQMLAIARGLIGRPAVLLLDEPTLGLAPGLVSELYDLIAELRDEGLTLVLVDQMAPLALSVADRGVVIESGRVRHEGEAGELARAPVAGIAGLSGS